MPKPVCVSCNTTRSLLWRVAGGGNLCHECYLIENGSDLAKSAVPELEIVDTKESKSETEPASSATSASNLSIKPKRGGNRWTRSRSTAASASNNANSQPKPQTTRGRGRRAIFKKVPLKAPTSSVSIVTSDTVYYNVCLL